MEREVMWESQDKTKFELVNLKSKEDGYWADGIIIHLYPDKSIRMNYQIQCDMDWKVRKVTLGQVPMSNHRIILFSDRNGHWTNNKFEIIPDLDECYDIDLYFSPFTNTLPIRRLLLKPGKSAKINVVFISIPDTTLSNVQQKYTHLDDISGGSLYLYENLDNGFKTKLPVDNDGLLMRYPGFFERIWNR